MLRNPLSRALALAVLTTLVGACSDAPPTAPASVTEVAKASDTVAWFDGDVDAAFAAAKAQDKPLFLYWGTEWCPYCAHLESAVFTDAGFRARAAGFVAMRVDGDHIDASALMERFKVTGYPTTQVFAPDGTELGRVPAGTLKADAYLAALDAVLQAGRSDRALFDAATKGEPLDGAEWLALSQSRELGNPVLNDAVQALAERCPPEHREAKLRLALLALLASPESVAKRWTTHGPTLRQVLADPQAMREQHYLLFDAKPVSELVPAEERESLRREWHDALLRLAADPAMSARARMMALNGALEAAPAIDAALAERTRALVAAVEREARTPLERQAALGSASSALVKIGDHAAADALITASLSEHRTPYYAMTALAERADKRGDTAAAAQWARRSYEDGIASPKWRVQLAAAGDYAKRLVEKTPERREEIREVTGRLFDIVAEGAAHVTPRRVEWLNARLGPVVAWSGQHDPALLAELKPRLDALCRTVPAEAQASCPKLLQAPG